MMRNRKVQIQELLIHRVTYISDREKIMQSRQNATLRNSFLFGRWKIRQLQDVEVK